MVWVLRDNLRQGGPRTRRRARAWGGVLLLLLVSQLLEDLTFFGRGRAFISSSSLAGSQGPKKQQERSVLHAVQEVEQKEAVVQGVPKASPLKKSAKQEAEILEFECVKFNLLWSKMKEAEENKSPDLATLKKEVEEQGKVVESLGGSLPAEMMTMEQMAAKAAKVKEDLTLDKLLNMTNEERWILAQGLGPAFPISLILSYTLYWTLNIPFISYAYFTSVVNGKATMALVMTGAYAASIPFKPFIYIGGMLGTPWTADNVMPLIGKFFNNFRLPDEDDFDRL